MWDNISHYQHVLSILHAIKSCNYKLFLYIFNIYKKRPLCPDDKFSYAFRILLVICHNEAEKTRTQILKYLLVTDIFDRKFLRKCVIGANYIPKLYVSRKMRYNLNTPLLFTFMQRDDIKTVSFLLSVVPFKIECILLIFCVPHSFSRKMLLLLGNYVQKHCNKESFPKHQNTYFYLKKLKYELLKVGFCLDITSIVE